MRKSLLLLILILFRPISVKAVDKADKVDALMKAYHTNGLFDGVVLAAERGKIIYHQAFGIADREWNIPMSLDTQFKIGSISKPFTALLILQLVQEGLLSLDGTIADYIPDYRGPLADRITVYHLLTHTSGIINALAPEQESVKERQYHNLRELIRYAEDANLVADPGSEFHYSNFAYNILAFMAETVTSKPFDRLLKDKIFDPVGMTNSGQYPNAHIQQHLAKGYEYRLLTGFENAAYFDNSYAVGCGGLISTVEDLYKFHRALLRQGDALISAELKEKMYTPTKQGQYGCGWCIGKKIINHTGDTLTIAEHSGSVNGFGSYMAQILNDSTLVVVLKNYRDDTYLNATYAPTIGQEIISILYDEDVQPVQKSIAKHIALTIGQNGAANIKEEYDKIKREHPDDYNFAETELNKLGIELLFRFIKPDEALRVFELNMIEFPHSYNTYDSYAYVLMQKKEYAEAIKYYRLGLAALEKYPDENNSQQAQADAQQALKYIEDMSKQLRP